MNFGAILTAMVTPFDADGRVDEAAAVRLLQHLFDNGSDGVVVCGTTGEAATLDDDEHLAFIEFVIDETRASHPGKTVIAGVGSNDTRHGVELTERATELRPDALLSVNPYYNRPNRRGVDRPLRGDQRRHRSADRALQHPAAHRLGHAQRSAGRARAA